MWLLYIYPSYAKHEPMSSSIFAQSISLLFHFVFARFFASVDLPGSPFADTVLITKFRECHVVDITVFNEFFVSSNFSVCWHMYGNYLIVVRDWQVFVDNVYCGIKTWYDICMMLLRIIYRTWLSLTSDKLGSRYLPMPTWLRYFFRRYSIRTRVILYARLIIGSKVYRNVDPEVACANVVTGIFELVDDSIFGAQGREDRINGTYTLSDVLSRHPRFRKLSAPQPGCVILSPTGKGKAGTVGHVGFVDVNGKSILSNSSYTGRFERNYTLDSWHKRYTVGFGIPPEYYIIVK